MNRDLNSRRELNRAFNDHATFCRESLSIRNLSGSVVPLNPFPGPLKLHAMIQRQRDAGKPVRIVVLKTRRSFFTAGVCAEMFHEIPFFSGRRGLIIADRYRPAGVEAFGYLLQYQNGYKPFERHGIKILLPELTKNTEQEIRWANDSSVDVLSAEGGEVRGGGRHLILCDEVAFWRNPAMTLTGVLNMVPYLPETMVIVQSTANGIGGEFYELCMRAQDPANQGGWEFVFFSWLEHPVYAMELTIDEKAALQERLTPEELDLQLVHHATLEQLAWRRKTIALECRGNLDVFNQEYPTTALDAFLASGRPVFDHKAIERMPIAKGVSGELEVIEEPMGKRLFWKPGDTSALTVWKRPQPGHRYVIGADPSKGKDVSGDGRGSNPDYSVAFVVDSGTGEQVALLRGRIRPAAFAEYLALLGRWYLRAYLVPEANDAGFIDALLRTGYLHSAIYKRQRDPTDRRPVRIEEIGFETTTLTRDWLVNAIDEAIRSMSIQIRSAVVAQECRTFVIKPNGKKEHQNGCHDDCVIALGLAAMGLRFLPKAAPEIRGRRKPFGVTYLGRKKRKDEDDDD